MYAELVYPSVRVSFFYWSTTKACNFSQKDKDISSVVYYRTCVCSNDYVESTECCSKERIGQHIPNLLNRGERSPFTLTN